MDVLITLDAGTGSGRCVAFDAAGRPLAGAQERFEYRVFADPDIPFVRGFDLDPAAFWGALARCARAVVDALPADARIRGVIATSQREGCVFLDAGGAVLYAGPNLDSRAAAEGLELQQRIAPERLHAVTGHAPPYIFPLARYLWFRKHRDARRVARLLMLNDWLTYLLSGAQVAERSNACESMLYDVTRCDWSAEVLDALDVPRAILAPVVTAGARVGAVTAVAAAASGIPAGTPVFAGGADTESALLGSGVWETGRSGAVLGTTAPVQTVVDRPVVDPAGTLWTSCHVVPDRWVVESNGGDTGGAWRWLLELLFGSADDGAHDAAEALAAATPTSERQVFSHLGPVVFDLREMNPFKPAGLLFRFPLLHVDRPARGELLRSYLESVAFAVRGNCEQLRAVTGIPIDALAASGGMTRSPTLAALIADTLGIPLDVGTVPESACLGSAMLAAVGAGIHPALADAVAAMVRTRRVAPDAERVALYDGRYRRWREIAADLGGWSL